MSNWIKCSERLPGEGQCVVIANIVKGYFDETAVVTYHPPHFRIKDGLDSLTQINIVFEATHWMPLPEAPEE